MMFMFMACLPEIFPVVMPGLVPGIHVVRVDELVDGRAKPGHDE
ncbi:hypothetical protein ACQR05_20445 [Bradyrhizobium oligotrophicum]